MFRTNFHSGFSLLELLIVVAIVGVLVTVSYSSHEYRMQQIHEAAAKQYLLEVSSLQNEYLVENYHYASTLSELGIAPRTEVSDYYSIAITQLDDQVEPRVYTLQATPKINSTQMSQQILELNHLGETNKGWHD